MTGNNYSLKQLLEKSNRVYYLTRMICTRLGISRKDDYPAERCFIQPVLSGPHAGKKLDRVAYDHMLDVYYERRGWSKDGKISKEREKEFLDEPGIL